VTRLYLIRHGQTDWNLEGRWQGHADVPLNQIGLQLSARLAQALAGVGLTAIYCSDLGRARQTAQLLAEATGLTVQVDARLREIDQGEWQGLLVAEIRARYGEVYELSRQNPEAFAPPGGETAAQVKRRLLEAIGEIHARHPDGRVAVVSHGFAVALLRIHFASRPMTDVWGLIPENEEWVEIETA
jgi:broad specificity phosphatase PhoE